MGLHPACPYLHVDARTDGSASDHGTCTASKAIVILFGAAKEATLVVAKMADYSIASMIEIFPTVTEHIRINDRQGKSVEFITWQSTPGEPLYNRMLRDLNTMLNQNIVVVCAAGNPRRVLGRSSAVDTAPADMSNLLPLLVASSCDSHGFLSPWSQTAIDIRRILAPADQITYAGPEGPSSSSIRSGTSFGKELDPISRALLTS